MAYKEFIAGTEALASDINTYLMNQSVMVFTNAAARTAAISTPTEGMVTYLTGSDHLSVYSGSEWVIWDLAWSAWTPTITGLTQGTGALTACYYTRVGKTIIAQGYISLGTGPTGIGTFALSLPVYPSGFVLRTYSIGTCFMRDSVGGRSYVGSAYIGASADLRFQAFNSSLTYAFATNQSASVPHAWTSGDYFQFTIVYQGV